MNTPSTSIGAQDKGKTDPFGVDAISAARRNFITDDEERQALGPQINQLREQGFVILKNLISGELLARLQDALDEINRQTRLGIYEFEGYRTHRAYCLVSKTRAFDDLVMNRSVLAIIEAYFQESPQLSASMGITIYEGQRAQPLHRDSGHYPLPWPRPPLEVNSIWALDEFRMDNGATRYVPRSHLILDETRPDSEPRVAEMEPGSVLIYDGALWHGGGASTAVGARRRCVNNLFTRQWLRQQDNLYLSLPVDEVLDRPKLMQRLMGYWIYGTTLGVVDGGPPVKYLTNHRINR